MPPSGNGGQQTPGAGEHGIGAGAPQGGLCGPQHAQSLHGPQPPPQGLQPPPPPVQHPPQERGSPPPPAQVAAVAAQRMRLLFTPMVMLANFNGNEAGQQVGVGKHMQPGRPWHIALGHLSCRPLRLMQSQLVYRMPQRSSRLRQPLG
ncbi:hypothetical protein ACLKA6_018307 [Drosophila palustris]